MPSLKNFKISRMTNKNKKNANKNNKSLEAEIPVPGPSQTPPTQRIMGKTAPAQLGERGRSGLSASMRTSSRSPTPSGRIQMDEHKQLKEADRPEEQANSSDPDTSLYEYEDDRLLASSLRKSISLPYGSNGGRRDSNSSTNTLATQPGIYSGTAVSTIREPTFEALIEPQTIVKTTTSNSLNLTIPKSGSPIHSVRSSPLSTRKTGTIPNSLRNSLEASIKSRSLQDASLKRSIEETEETLDEQVYNLANLTMQEKPRAVSDQEQLAYFRKLESSTEHTLRDQEELIEKLKQRNENLEQMNQELLRYKELHDGQDVVALKTRIKDLESLVYKLNQQLSVCQAQHQQVTDANGAKIQALPEDAPTPAWMVNFKYLSPLIKALEDQAASKAQELNSLKKKFSKYETDIKRLLDENDSLRKALKAGKADPDSIGKKAWSQLQQQALLVLEENDILLGKLDLQHDKLLDFEEKHFAEVEQYEEKVRRLEAERHAVSEQLTDAKYELQVTKAQYEDLKHTSRQKVDQEEYNRVTIDFKTKIESMQDLHERERQALHQRYSSSEMTRQELDSNLSGMKNENTELHYEIKRRDKEIKALEQEVVKLGKDVESANEVVSRLLMLTDVAVTEKQSLKSYIKSETRERKKSAGVIIEGELVKEKLLAEFKKYKLKAEDKMEKLSIKLEKQAGEFDLERREYERQIKHLRLMVHDKDVLVQEAAKDKQQVEDCLEFVWKATETDNHYMRDSIRKSIRESQEKYLSRSLNSDTSEIR